MVCPAEVAGAPAGAAGLAIGAVTPFDYSRRSQSSSALRSIVPRRFSARCSPARAQWNSAAISPAPRHAARGASMGAPPSFRPT
eukprot:50449-Pyramimonas_sp.AAC.1